MSAYPMWLPRSACGSQCLPPESAVPRVSPTLATIRMLAVLVVLLVGSLALPLLTLFPTHSARALARALLAVFGVQHRVTGRLPQRGALVVANHVSWIDVLVLLAHSPARLIAKSEVRGWPLIGSLAKANRCVFLNRTSPKSLPATVAGAADALRAGAVVAVFPEGTTWCGRANGPFRPAMFQAAVDAGVPVVPVTLRFALADGTGTTVAAYVGDDTLWASVNRVACTRGLRVAIRAHQPLHPAEGASRRALARATATQLAPELGFPPLLEGASMASAHAGASQETFSFGAAWAQPVRSGCVHGGSRWRVGAG